MPPIPWRLVLVVLILFTVALFPRSWRIGAADTGPVRNAILSFLAALIVSAGLTLVTFLVAYLVIWGLRG